jgi:hypothetical protein
MARTMLSESNSKKKNTDEQSSYLLTPVHGVKREGDHLLDGIRVVVQVEVDVCTHTPELDGGLVVGSGKDHRTGGGFQITLQFVFVNAEQACRVVLTLQQPAPCQTHLEKRKQQKSASVNKHMATD